MPDPKARKRISASEATDALSDREILAEAELLFVDNDQVGEGLCSCVCINDERCCGCIFQ
jgi:hypothetical protein